MADLYLIATGHDVAKASLAAISPQPRTDKPAQPVQRNYSVSGAVIDIGLWTPLLWNFIDTPAIYATLLGQFGLTSARSANVTVWAPNDLFVFGRYNAIAIRPAPGSDVERNNFFIRDLTIRLINLEFLAEP